MVIIAGAGCGTGPCSPSPKRQNGGVSPVESPTNLRVAWHVDLVEIVSRRSGLPGLKKMSADGR